MPQTNSPRPFYVLKYLWEHTDEDHPVTLEHLFGNRQGTFRYYEYDREEKKVLRYDGYRYRFSPTPWLGTWKIKIIAPEEVKQEFNDVLRELL